MAFFGREYELKELNELYDSSQSNLAVIYGRRRVGKSKLIQKFCDEKISLLFEGLENKTTKAQITHFHTTLLKQVQDRGLGDFKFTGWDGIFSYLTQWLAKQNGRKVIIFFDEFQWMSASRTSLVSLIKYYWDNEWKKYPLTLILCGSIASFMLEKVIKSKALYGRISLELHVHGLNPYEALKMFHNKRSQEECLKYLMIFGGIPKYLEEIQLNRSFEQNMERLCFRSNGLMTHEFERIFYNQFSEASLYLDIIQCIQFDILSLEQIAKKVKLSSGGGLKRYLNHLQAADFIKIYTPLGRKLTTKVKRYQLSDEYLLFYFKYMQPNMKLISENSSLNLFEKLVLPQWNSWLGFAFEKFCLKNAFHLSKVMGFSDQVIGFGPYFERSDKGFQIDLIFQRADHVYTICEIKYHHKAIGTSIIPEVEKKIELIKNSKELSISGITLEKCLISLYGPDQSLRDSKYFHHTITLNELFAK